MSHRPRRKPPAGVIVWPAFFLWLYGLIFCLFKDRWWGDHCWFYMKATGIFLFGFLVLMMATSRPDNPDEGEDPT